MSLFEIKYRHDALLMSKDTVLKVVWITKSFILETDIRFVYGTQFWRHLNFCTTDTDCNF